MTDEQIILLWKLNYSKAKIYKFEYYDLEKRFSHLNKISLEKRAKANVDLVLEIEFKKGL